MSTESSYYLEEPSNTSFEETTMKNTFTYKKYNCNIHRCRYCHPEKRNLTKKELEAIRKKSQRKTSQKFQRQILLRELLLLPETLRSMGGMGYQRIIRDQKHPQHRVQPSKDRRERKRNFKQARKI